METKEYISKAGIEREGKTMGKKLFMGMMAMAFVVAFAGVGQATLWVDRTALPGVFGIGTINYTHDMPLDFSVPPDQVISADLEISYTKGIGFGSIFVQGQYVDSRWIFDFDKAIDTETFSITGTLGSFPLGGSLDITLAGVAAICFTESELTLEYNNVNNIPESSTLLLMGSGLLGLAVYGRKRMKN